MKIREFTEWLRQQGAEVLAPTNPYELVRFRARSAVHVVYTGRRGISMGKFARDCFDVFNRGGSVNMGLTATQRSYAIKHKAALLERDGDGCFFCLKAMPSDDMTIEHLVPVHKGGPDHQDNMALAHAACNQAAGNLPLRRKIDIRTDAMLGGARP